MIEQVVGTTVSVALAQPHHGRSGGVAYLF